MTTSDADKFSQGIGDTQQIFNGTPVSDGEKWACQTWGETTATYQSGSPGFRHTAIPGRGPSRRDHAARGAHLSGADLTHSMVAPAPLDWAVTASKGDGDKIMILFTFL